MFSFNSLYFYVTKIKPNRLPYRKGGNLIVNFHFYQGIGRLFLEIYSIKT